VAELYVNQRALTSLVSAVLVENWQLDGLIGGSVPTTPSLETANAGAVYGSSVTLQGRRITASLRVRAATIADRETYADALLIALSGLLELSTDAATGRVWYGVLAGTPTMEAPGVFAIPVLDITFVFDLANPTRYALDPYTRALSTARVACPVGTLASQPRVWLYGNATPIVNPHVIVRSHTGEIVCDLALTVSLGSNTALDIGRTPERIESYAAGVLQTGALAGLALYTSGRFPVLSPDDANPAASAWPTVELSSDSGTPTGLLLAREAW
jgi:hypothetical protein